MRSIPAFLCCASLIFSATAATAQPRASRTFEPPAALFQRLFRECRECADRPRAVHLVMDSPRLTDDWLARHTYQSNGGSYGDNAAVADFWYDAIHRRLVTRSLVLHEVDDPADLRLGRAPGRFPNDPDFARPLEPGTVVGTIGFVRWSSNGFGSYFAAVNGAVRDTGTGYLDLATVTGKTGMTRTGSLYDPEDLVRHVRLHPSGQVEIGYDTDPAAAPDTSLLVRGNVEVEGKLTVNGTAISTGTVPRPLACIVRSGAARGRAAAAACIADEIATGGGGTCGSGEMRGSRPLLEAATPHGWEVACSRDGTHSAYAVCCSP